MLENRDRHFNRRIECLIRESDEWLSGDREAAVNAPAVRQAMQEHGPVVERLMELPDLIAEAPAYSRDALLQKLRYLRTLLDGVELDIVESIIEDVEFQG